MYEMVTLHELEQDQMLWQTPTLALTAQAFLLTVALARDATSFTRCLSAGLGVVVACLSMQLMAKHRYLAILDRWYLSRLERDDALGLPPINNRGWAFAEQYPQRWYRRRPMRKSEPDAPGDSFFRRRRSYVVWQVGIALFGLANVGIVAITLTGSTLLSGK